MFVNGDVATYWYFIHRRTSHCSEVPCKCALVFSHALYVGVILDDELIWRAHVRVQVKKELKAL